MPYIIDGHNLIPKIAGIALDDVDDEIRLIELLQEFCRNRRKEIEVYFDNAPPGGVRAHKYGAVTAHFVRQGKTADEAIGGRLNRLGGAARNYTLVSSDRAVQAAGRSVRAKILASEDFAEILLEERIKTNSDIGEQPEAKLNPDEVEEWLSLFGEGEEDS